MIDIHCHILPGIDDGAKTSKDTLIMLKSAIDEGITAITATPHHNSEFNNESPLILKKVKEVQNIIEEHQLPIAIFPGQEVRIYGDLLKDFSDGKLLTAARTSDYMLIEFPSNHVPGYAKELFYNLQLQGIQPILVHPERNSGIIENPGILFDFIEQGVLSQITASSVTGHFGKKIQKLTFKMIENHLTHFVASDAHNVTSRAFKMKEAFEIIEDRYGFDRSQNFKDNAKSVILNKSVYKGNPVRIKTRKLLGLFKKV
jgi:protein-tyrosine phosphatase